MALIRMSLFTKKHGMLIVAGNLISWHLSADIKQKGSMTIHVKSNFYGGNHHHGKLQYCRLDCCSCVCSLVSVAELSQYGMTGLNQSGFCRPSYAVCAGFLFQPYRHPL